MAQAFLPVSLFVLLLAAAPGSAVPPPPEQLDSSISRGVKFLLERQEEDGGWHDGQENDPRSVGRTALVCMALVNAGESHQSEPLRKAIAFLKQSKVDYTYSIGLRAAFFSLLPDAISKPQLQTDTRWLIDNRIRSGPAAGMYTYTSLMARGGGGDYSNSQYGVLGVWYAAAAGVEVPNSYWSAVDKAWRNGQQDDGGWGYHPRDGSYASMTAAGIATLYVTYDYIHAPAERALGRSNTSLEALTKGVDWLSRHFSVEQNAGRDFGIDPNRPPRRRPRRPDIGGMSGTYVYYMLFGFERVGEATGLTRLGENKWFDDGADFIINTQRDDGGWDGVDETWRDVNSAYALLFLARGRAPIAIQKLDFGHRWNNRSRDAAELARWLSRQTERHMNWQIVGGESSAAELRESPILYLATDEALELSQETRDRIRDFILQGGVLLCAAEGIKETVVESIELNTAAMFPGYKFRDLPPDHLLFTSNFAAKEGTPVVRGLSNGVRELVIVIPSGDISWRWQNGAGAAVASKSPQFGLIGNLHLYMTDRANPRFKGVDFWVDPAPDAPVEKTIKIARLMHGQNADPEPAGWQRFANILRREHHVDVQIAPTDPLHLAGDAKIAHLTATAMFKLSPEQTKQIRAYADAGGLLLCDAAGGAPMAVTSIEDALRQIYPTGKLDRLPIDHPIYTLPGRPMAQVSYRKFAIDKLPRTNLPRLRGLTVDGKLRAIVSDEDFSSGLVGHAVDGIVGYSPQSAVDLVTNIVLWRLSSNIR